MRTRYAVVAAALIVLAGPAIAAEPAADATASEMVAAAMKPCMTDVGPTHQQQIRDMLMIKARAITGNKPLAKAEQNRAEGMLMATEDEAAIMAVSCIADGTSPLADWIKDVTIANIIPPDAIDPLKEAKRIAKICTYGVGASVRDRYAALVAGALRWRFVEALEKRSLDTTEQKQFTAARNASRVIPEKVSNGIIDCVIATTKDTPVMMVRPETKAPKAGKKK